MIHSEARRDISHGIFEVNGRILWVPVLQRLNVDDVEDGAENLTVKALLEVMIVDHQGLQY